MKELLKELCTAAGVNGVTDAADLLAQRLSALVPTVQRDGVGNVWGIRPAAVEQAPTLLLEAHWDEIGCVVTGVTDDGFLRVSACGGVDERVLAAAQVRVLCDPPLSGVFCSTPPHLGGEGKTVLSAEERGIDVGLSAAEARERVPLGTRVMFAPHFEELLNDCVCSKALDNRAGCAAIVKALELLGDAALPYTVVALFCAQEEVGTRGASPATFAIDPDAAIAVDVSFGYTPDADPQQCGTVGGGVMLGVSPILHDGMTKQLDELALQHHIALQYEPMGGRTGTDTDAISVTRVGVPSALLSIPLRYMHTPNEVVSVRDVEGVARLLAAFAAEGEVPSYA